MNSFCLRLGKEMTVKNFIKVVKKFISVLIFQKGNPLAPPLQMYAFL